MPFDRATSLLVLCVALALSLGACGAPPRPSSVTSAPDPAPAAAAAPAPAPASPTTEALPPAPEPPLSVPIELACGVAHARLPEGVEVTADAACEPEEDSEHIGVRLGASRHTARAGDCEVVIEARTSISFRDDAWDHPEPTSYSLQTGRLVLGLDLIAGEGCVDLQAAVRAALARSTAIDGPIASSDRRARFVVSTDDDAIALELPDGYMITAFGDQPDEYESSWLITPIAGEGAAATLYGYWSGYGVSMSHFTEPVVFRARAFGASRPFHEGYEPYDRAGDGETPCGVATAYTGRGEHPFEVAIIVCGPDDPSRAALLRALGAARFVR